METVQSCKICGAELIESADPGWNLCQCVACGYMFDNPRPTLEELSEFYSKPNKYDSWIDELPARDALWRRRLNKLLPHRAAGNLLDVGAGIGQFLHHARPFFTDVYGTEVSESAVRIAKERYGFDIHRGALEQLDLPSAFFDNITLFHVLEHVPDPSRVIAICWRLLRAKGTLAIAVPNDVLAWTSWLKSMGRRCGLPAFQKFSPKFGLPKAGSSREIHLSHFTPDVLRRLVESYPFEVLEESLDPYYVATGAKRALDFSYYALHRALFSIYRTNRYDTIWMVARKHSTARTQPVSATGQRVA
jgi:SAM-dependent methyltransferase